MVALGDDARARRGRPVPAWGEEERETEERARRGHHRSGDRGVEGDRHSIAGQAEIAPIATESGIIRPAGR